MNQFFKQMRDEASRCCPACLMRWTNVEETYAERIYRDGVNAGSEHYKQIAGKLLYVKNTDEMAAAGLRLIEKHVFGCVHCGDCGGLDILLGNPKEKK